MRNVAAEPYREIDFSRAKRGPVIPLEPGKTKISIRLDNRVIDHFRAIVEKAGGGNYQTLINDANPELMRLALKLATGAGKTTVMAMLIAWQTINAVRRPQSKRFTRGFLVVTPGLTIKDRLRVLQPNDPDSYYANRELVPGDMLDDMNRAKIVITNYHAFKLRERIELSKGGRSLLQGRGELLREDKHCQYSTAYRLPASSASYSPTVLLLLQARERATKPSSSSI